MAPFTKSLIFPSSLCRVDSRCSPTLFTRASTMGGACCDDVFMSCMRAASAWRDLVSPLGAELLCFLMISMSVRRREEGVVGFSSMAFGDLGFTCSALAVVIGDPGWLFALVADLVVLKIGAGVVVVVAEKGSFSNTIAMLQCCKEIVAVALLKLVIEKGDGNRKSRKMAQILLDRCPVGAEKF
ncbi:hypothetical protein H4582DRAFT_2129730 [Lactarius indigo]|nr:hypothetical protein H4582DRAFT_2129730 [Lactarius indigo]